MQTKQMLFALVSVALLGSVGVASAQGPGASGAAATIPESDVRPSMGNTTGNGAMRQGIEGTTGISTRRSEQDSPNGSPTTPPISREGPGGDPSKNNDAPK
jgi:hypothetical protein